jgi:hypothetical protein
MRTIVFFSLLSVLFLNSCASKKVNNKDDDHIYSKKNHPVKELYMSSIEAFNQGNPDVFLKNFDVDIKMYGTDGMYFGIDALRKRFDGVFKQFPDVRMEIIEFDLEILSDEIVLVNFKWKVYPMGQGPAYSGLGSGIYVYKEHQWTEILEAEKVTEIDKELIRAE